MKQLEDINSELVDILNSAKSNRFSDVKEAILELIKKNLVFNSEDINLTYEDFQRVVSNAKTSYSKEAFPIYVKNSRGFSSPLETTENANFLMFVAVLDFLTSKEAFKKNPSFKKGR